jgi:hypothetical protein
LRAIEILEVSVNLGRAMKERSIPTAKAMKLRTDYGVAGVGGLLLLPLAGSWIWAWRVELALMGWLLIAGTVIVSVGCSLIHSLLERGSKAVSSRVLRGETQVKDVG